MAFTMYRLSPLGYKMSHSTDNSSPEMRIIHYLARNHTASQANIYANTNADSGALSRLIVKGLVLKE